MIFIKDQATLLAVGGVILIMIGVIILTGVTKQELDTELIKLVATGLLGFAGGIVTASK